jgi:WD40 repeat protein
MKSLLKRYSFCSFHKDSQHFFIPNSVHEIIIYDLRTAMKWKSLKGHDSQIECLAVIENGNTLASFSRKEKTVKFWKVASFDRR